MPENRASMSPKWLGDDSESVMWEPFYEPNELRDDIRAVPNATLNRRVNDLAQAVFAGITINVTLGDIAHIITGLGGNAKTAQAIAAITGKPYSAVLRHVQRHAPAKVQNRKQNLTGMAKDYQAAWRQLYLQSGRGPWSQISISARGVIQISEDVRRRTGGNTYPREQLQEVLDSPIWAIQGFMDNSQWRFSLLTCEAVEVEIY